MKTYALVLLALLSLGLAHSSMANTKAINTHMQQVVIVCDENGDCKPVFIFD